MMMMLMIELFLLTISVTVGRSVTQTIFSVDTLSVQQGQSIAIPCVYKAENMTMPRCFAHLWMRCNDVMQMNPSKTVYISGKKKQHIFNVTMRHLTLSNNTTNYFCSIDTPGHDKRKSFRLKVRKANPELYVDDQMVTGYESSHVVISCHQRPTQSQAWCKIDDAGLRTIGSKSGASVQLGSMDGGFRVTMSELTMENTGWYWCSIGNEQILVHVSVAGRTRDCERSSFAWLVFLGLLLAVACMAVFWQHKQKWKMLSIWKRSDNTYVSMKRPRIQTSQQKKEDTEAQDYEVMSSPQWRPEMEGTLHI